MTNKRPSLGLPNLKSISVPPRSAIDTGTYEKQKVLSVVLNKQFDSTNIYNGTAQRTETF